MKDTVLQFVGQVTHEEKLELQMALEKATAEEMAPGATDAVDSRPRCGGPRFARKGHGRKGERRWPRHGCGRTFGPATSGPLARSKPDAAAWREFARRMVDCVPLRDCAEGCGTSLAAARLMRRRTCEAMASRLAAFRVEKGASCQVDGTFLNESPSGDWGKSTGFEVPREPHKNGEGVKARGISNLRICVLCGADDLGDVFCEPSNRGRAASDDIERALSGKIAGARSRRPTSASPIRRRPRAWAWPPTTAAMRTTAPTAT